MAELTYEDLITMSEDELRALPKDKYVRDWLRKLVTDRAVLRSREMQYGLTAEPNPDRTVFYVEYLRSTEWQVFRAAVLALAGWKCVRCKADGVALNVHHKHYRTLGNELPKDVEVLCRPCHEKEHGL